MSSDETTAQIKAFWESRALNTNLAVAQVTLPDSNQRNLEIETVLKYLPRGQYVLDVGCGNGYSTSIFAPYGKQIVGIDYSESMIARAKQEYGQLANVKFEVKDLLQLDFPPDTFDVAIAQRCLINLPTWEKQQQAIKNVARVLKPGGVFILQEGTQQGREQLNQTREFLGLPRMPPVAYNLDFDEKLLWPFVRNYFDLVEVKRFGLYDLIARIVHPLLIQPEEPRYDAKINQIAAQISAKLEGADFLSREFSAVLRKLERRER